MNGVEDYNDPGNNEHTLNFGNMVLNNHLNGCNLPQHSYNFEILFIDECINFTIDHLHIPSRQMS